MLVSGLQLSGQRRGLAETIQAALQWGPGPRWERENTCMCQSGRGPPTVKCGGPLKERLLLLQSLECSGSSSPLHVPRDLGVSTGRGLYYWRGQGAAWSDLGRLDKKRPRTELLCCWGKPGRRQEVKEKVRVH